MILIIVGILIVVLVLYVIVSYNALVREKNKVKTNWAQIDVVLKRRADLIPNLVETVKGYAKHEKETLDSVMQARNTYMNASIPSEQMEAAGELTQALNKIMAISEAYPDLKANANFVSLQNELTQTEDKISFARQFYNDSVYSYTNKLEMFPSSLIANLFHFERFDYFEINENDKDIPEVKF